MLPPQVIYRFPGAARFWGRVTLAALAFLPLLVVVPCTIPAFVLWPFVPVTREESAKRIDQLQSWTRLILDSLFSAEAVHDRAYCTMGEVTHEASASMLSASAASGIASTETRP
jgi:hypothetical protein